MNDSDLKDNKKEEQKNQSAQSAKSIECDGQPCPVIWHFVLKHLDEGTPLGRLRTKICIKDEEKEYYVSGVYRYGDKDMHFYIETEQDGKLNSAVANVKEQKDTKKAKLILNKIYKNVKSGEIAVGGSENKNSSDNNVKSKPKPFSENKGKSSQDNDGTGNNAFSSISHATIILIALIFLFAVLFNVFIVEFERYEIRKVVKQQEETTIRLNERLENIKKELAQKNMETSELIDFHNDFVPIWQKYQSSIKLISINNDSKSSSLEDVISLTSRRLEISKKYFDDFKALKIPDVLKSFYKSSTEFIESDINLWETILAYYNMNNPEQFDASTIEELGNESKKLYEKANKELMEIYDTHSLGYFFKEYE